MSIPIDGGGSSATRWLSETFHEPQVEPDPPPQPRLIGEPGLDVFYEPTQPQSVFQRHAGPTSFGQDLLGLPTTQTVITFDTPLVYTDEGALRAAYQSFAEEQGLSRPAAREYADRAYELTEGRAYAPSTDANEDGRVLTAAELRAQRASGRLEIGLSRAQLGLLHGMLAQPTEGGESILGPLGAASVGTQFFPRAANVVPGQTSVPAEIAVQMLENMADGRPPFRPELGNVGQVSWFVTEGSPHTGPGQPNSVTIPVDIETPTNGRVIEFNEAQLLEIFEAEQRSALQLAESQYRVRNGIAADAPLSNTAMRRIQRNAAAIAERQMWTRVGETVAASDSGMGRVNLRNSIFSRSGDGQFTLTRSADAVKIRGGANALIDILQRNGQPVDDAVRESVERLAAQRNWAGRLRGVFRVGGRVLIVVGAAADGYRIYSADDRWKEAAEVAGGWSGAAAASSAFAAWAAPINTTGPWGWAAYGLGTLGAGAVGYFVGESVAGEVYELVVDGDPMYFGPED